MIYEGQEFIRSKWGIRNTYNRGDAVNAIRWTDRDRPIAKETLAYYAGLIQLRMSDAGEALRVAQRPPSSYYKWITPKSPTLFGYIVNVPELHNGRGFAVLYNTSPAAQLIPLELGGKTAWRMIGNGREMYFSMSGTTNALSSSAKLIARPRWPARAVRPTRWT